MTRRLAVGVAWPFDMGEMVGPTMPTAVEPLWTLAYWNSSAMTTDSQK